MKAMKAKIIAIFAFPFQFLQGILMIFGMLFGGRGQSEIATHNKGDLPDATKYDNMLGQPTAEIVSGIQPVFCPECHQLVAYTRKTNRGLEIFQDGKKLVTVGGNVSISANGRRQSGLPFKCPAGHRVMIGGEA